MSKLNPQVQNPNTHHYEGKNTPCRMKHLHGREFEVRIIDYPKTSPFGFFVYCLASQAGRGVRGGDIEN